MIDQSIKKTTKIRQTALEAFKRENESGVNKTKK
jgi:hypothetical protein